MLRWKIEDIQNELKIRQCYIEQCLLGNSGSKKTSVTHCCLRNGGAPKLDPKTILMDKHGTYLKDPENATTIKY